MNHPAHSMILLGVCEELLPVVDCLGTSGLDLIRFKYLIDFTNPQILIAETSQIMGTMCGKTSSCERAGGINASHASVRTSGSIRGTASTDIKDVPVDL